jgi:hypothetical protein
VAPAEPWVVWALPLCVVVVPTFPWICLGWLLLPQERLGESRMLIP